MLSIKSENLSVDDVVITNGQIGQVLRPKYNKLEVILWGKGNKVLVDSKLIDYFLMID